MFASKIGRYAAPLTLIAALGGCAGQQGTGGSIPQIASPLSQHRVMPAGQPPVAHTSHRSWMKPLVPGTALLYVSDTVGHVVDVYTYPNLKKVGELAGFGNPEGECTDRSGNVWIADAGGAVYEYAHGGANPIVTLLADMNHPSDCAVDPRSGDLAVANGNAQVLIFHTGSSSPSIYSDANFFQTAFLGYDSRGNLFVDGMDSSNQFFWYAELPAGGQSFTDVTLNYGTFPQLQSPGGVHWDGTHMAIGDTQSTIYQTQGSNVVSTTTISTTCAFDFALTKSRRAPLVAADQCTGGGVVDTFAYPGGGSPIKQITSGLNTPYGAVVSR